MQRQGASLKKLRRNRYTHYWVVLAMVRLRRRSKKSRHRRFVLEQWLKTQRSFRNDLQLALKYIKNSLMKRGLVDKEGASILCTQFQPMGALSDKMIKAVGVIQKELNPNRIMIGRELIQLGSFYKLYSPYFGNRMRSEKFIKQLFEQHQKEMRQVQQEFKTAARTSDQRKQNMTISDCLQQPQYRMFKYVLLLKEYVKKLPRWHGDWQHIHRALEVFQEINHKNNELMVKLQAQEKKIKLDRLFGKSIFQSSHYIVEMTAQSIYFPVKLYIFSNLIIVAAVENILGFQQERRFVNLALNQYSYVHAKRDGKYFKNGLLLCGQYEALHLFTPEPGERQEILRTMERVIAELQESACAKRKKQKGGENSGKLTFVLNVGQDVVFAPQFRVQVVHIEVRPLKSLSNDTVYLTRFAGPLWLQDCSLVGLQPGRVRRGVWQLVQLHMSQVMQLYQSLQEEYPQIQFPKIDPFTKEMNAWTESKKSTKMFEVRGYLFQQFFNFVLRHPTVMRNPLEIVHRYKLLPIFWQYLIKKNDYLSGREESKKDNMQYQYGGSHCRLCDFMLRAPLQSLEKVRADMMHGKRSDHCFNAFCLLRLRVAALPEAGFNSVQLMLWRQLLQAGRMDYALLPRQQLHKRYQQIPVWVCGDSQKHVVLIDYRRKVGEMMIDLGYFLGLQDALDFRLVLRYDGKERLLDQDEVLFDLLSRYQLPAFERQDQSRESRHSVNVTTINKQQGLFSSLKSFFSSKMDSSLQLRKVVFLPKEVQIRSFVNSFKRAKYVIQELYWRLSKGEIPLEVDDWAQACGLWVVLNAFSLIQTHTNNELVSFISEKLIPQYWWRMAEQKQFLKQFVDVIEAFRKKQPLTDKQLMGCYKRCIRVFYRSVWSYSYVVDVTARGIPSQVVLDGLGAIEGECLLGINFKELVVFRRKGCLLPAAKFSLQDMKVTHTTYSLFIEYIYEVALISETTSIGERDPKRSTLRFDAKLLYHFSYLVELYGNLRRIFSMVV